MKKKSMKYIIFSMFKIKIISHSNMFYFKKNEISLIFNNILLKYLKFINKLFLYYTIQYIKIIYL